MAAKKMVLSKSTIPHALLVDEADATNLLSMREALREIGAKEGVRITILPFIVQTVVTALRVHPAMNASLDETRGEIVRKRRYDIGMAVDMEDGLVVPVPTSPGAPSRSRASVRSGGCSATLSSTSPRRRSWPYTRSSGDPSYGRGRSFPAT
jgi:hypothetical protein